MTPEEALSFGAKLAGLLLDLLPHEQAKGLLDDEAAHRADLAADLAEAAKFSQEHHD